MMIVWRIRGRFSEPFCAVLCTSVVYSDMHTWAVLIVDCWFRFALDSGLLFVCFFAIFVSVVFAFVDFMSREMLNLNSIDQP